MHTVDLVDIRKLAINTWLQILDRDSKLGAYGDIVQYTLLASNGDVTLVNEKGESFINPSGSFDVMPESVQRIFDENAKKSG